MGNKFETKTLPDGTTFRYRPNPPRDADGNPKPTVAQRRAREQARKRMSDVAHIMRLKHPSLKPFTREYYNAISAVMKDVSAVRVQTCRKNGKFARCKNV